MNSTGEELHPNWRALTTLHVPLKRFIRAGVAEQEKGKVAIERHTIDGVSGAEVQQFYQEILETPETKSKSQTESTTKAPSRVKEKKPPLQPFDKNKFFRLAIGNNVNELSQMCISEEEQLNSKDNYNWTALMMAACEGAADTVAWLLQLGASTEVADKSGNTALQLARSRGHAGIMQLLEAAESSFTEPDDEEESTATAIAPFYCRVCQREYSESTWREHQTSTVHQFNMKSLPAHRLQKFNIPARNRGLQLMLKQGWDREHGLGPTQNGRLYPVKTVLWKQRTGLGIQQSPARVTHFQAFDLNATRYRNGAGGDPRRQPRRTRDDMRREKLQDWRRERRLRSELS